MAERKIKGILQISSDSLLWNVRWQHVLLLRILKLCWFMSQKYITRHWLGKPNALPLWPDTAVIHAECGLSLSCWNKQGIHWKVLVGMAHVAGKTCIYSAFKVTSEGCNHHTMCTNASLYNRRILAIKLCTNEPKVWATFCFPNLNFSLPLLIPNSKWAFLSYNI